MTQTIKTEKISRGHYLITREDGYRIEVMRGTKGWFKRGSGLPFPSLGAARFDMEHGYMPHDLLNREAR